MNQLKLPWKRLIDRLRICLNKRIFFYFDYLVLDIVSLVLYIVKLLGISKILALFQSVWYLLKKCLLNHVSILTVLVTFFIFVILRVVLIFASWTEIGNEGNLFKFKMLSSIRGCIG